MYEDDQREMTSLNYSENHLCLDFPRESLHPGKFLERCLRKGCTPDWGLILTFVQFSHQRHCNASLPIQMWIFLRWWMELCCPKSSVRPSIRFSINSGVVEYTVLQEIISPTWLIPPQPTDDDIDLSSRRMLAAIHDNTLTHTHTCTLNPPLLWELRTAAAGRFV